MRLYDLKEGEAAVIERLALEESFAVRLRDMGFCESERVSCVRLAAMKSPVIYRVKGSLVALRKKDAERIDVSYE